VEFNTLFMLYVATLGSGDPEDNEPMAWGDTQEEAANELLALNGFPQDTPYVVC
jgi:hypothetical protein